MTATPSFSLPACPICSSWAHFERPYWRFAHNTSRARGYNCYIWVGCSHAAEITRPGEIRDDAEVWALIEEQWAARVAELFEAHTADWTEAQRAHRRRVLTDRSFIPGAVEPLQLETPA